MEKMISYQIGDCEVFKVLEIEASYLTAKLFPDQSLSADVPENIVLSMHSWLVRTPEKLIVIDTATGNGRNRPGAPLFHQLNTPYEQRLREAGVDPDRVDLVLMTHLHGDHVGWNTHWQDGKWQPLFKNARYHCSHRDLASWQQDPARQNIMADSLTPIIEAGLLDTIDVSREPEFAGVLRYKPTPGHTEHHASIILHSAGKYAFFSGDLMHNEIQVKQPHLASRFCANAEQAEAQRRLALGWAADHQALWFSSHFAESSAGYITRKNEGFEWCYS
jgi:glyoxylase-like metal-dependent hydrolase (beta-lactamase superfamily II)